MLLSVVIPTHNPHAGRLRRTLAALQAQTLASATWETLLVDNASRPVVAMDEFAADAPVNLRVVRESQLGLTAARRRGFTEARGDCIVMVDDDNALAANYLAEVLQLFAAHPKIGALGGKSRPEFETQPRAWIREFDGLIACRDLGEATLTAHGLWNTKLRCNEYPGCAPIGAGMALRREALQSWLDDSTSEQLSDRRGSELNSGGDNDIVLTLLRHGWQVGYFPTLSLIHMIPTSRTTRDYLGRLNHGIACSWVQVLSKHNACPWGRIPTWTVPLRQAKAWFTYRAWSGPAAYVRWQGACGHFAGLAHLPWQF